MRQRTLTITGTGIKVTNSYKGVKPRKAAKHSKPHRTARRPKKQAKKSGGGFFDW